jgi:hypothetical protein
MMNASAAVIAASSAAFSSGVSNIHRCSCIPPSPIGFSRLCRGPAMKPSAETAGSLVT